MYLLLKEVVEVEVEVKKVESYPNSKHDEPSFVLDTNKDLASYGLLLPVLVLVTLSFVTS